MGVFRPRGRSDSRVSGLPSRRSPFVDDEAPDAIEPPVEQANNGSPPRTPLGIESLVSGGTSHRTPSRSFYHRSFNSTAGVKQEPSPEPQWLPGRVLFD